MRIADLTRCVGAVLASILFALASCSTEPVAPPVAPQVAAPASAAPLVASEPQRERMLSIAHDYADFEWQGSARNVLHGADADGVYVDTPDVSFDPKGWTPDAPHHGVPYAWGGFTSLEEFRAGLLAGRPAGQVPKGEHVRPSSAALGLDCSGFIARCWELPVKQSTRSLGALCYPLPDQAALQPGDILDLFDGHVVLFERWTDATRTRMKVFEAGRLAVKESEYSAASLQQRGFQPMRYKPLDARWVPIATDAPAFVAADGAALPEGHWTADGPPVALADAAAPSPLTAAHPRQWAQYHESGNDPQAPGESERTTLVSAVDGERVDTETETRLGGGSIFTGRSCEHAAALVEALIDFAAPDEPLSAIVVQHGTVTPGHYELAGRSFAAQRVEAQLGATHVVRHADLPETVTLDCIVAPDIAVHGVLEARFRWDTTWSAESGKDPVVGTHSSHFVLRGFGGPR